MVICGLGALNTLPPVTIWIGVGASLVALLSLACYAYTPSRTSYDYTGDRRALMVTRDDRAHQRIETHAETGDISGAWEQYKLQCQHEAGWRPSDQVGTDLDRGKWTHLPSELLANAMVDQWRDQGFDVCPEFVRDCAIAYPTFSKQCFEKEVLWSCFSAYPEYVADIAKHHPQFGLHVITSAKGEQIRDDALCLEIFLASYESLLAAIDSNNLSGDHARCLARFLIRYQYVICRETFEKIQQIRSQFEAQGMNSAVLWMNLVEGKLSFQGIYEGERGSTFSPPTDLDLVDGVFDARWIEEIARRASLATEDANVQKGMLYLSLIPDSHPGYQEAQMMLGHIWLDIKNHAEAGVCFLRIAEDNEDARLLAAMCLVAVQQTGEMKTFVLRQNQQELGENMRTLTPDEARSLSLSQLRLLMHPS